MCAERHIQVLERQRAYWQVRVDVNPVYDRMQSHGISLLALHHSEKDRAEYGQAIREREFALENCAALDAAIAALRAAVRLTGEAASGAPSVFAEGDPRG
jgi:hypothetical protein